MILPNFVKNCIKLRKFWAVGGEGGVACQGRPLNPSLQDFPDGETPTLKGEAPTYYVGQFFLKTA